MNNWEMLKNKYDLRYAYKPDRRYWLRYVAELSGTALQYVWVLYFRQRRIWEVHALGNIGIVQADAEEYIRAARVAG